MNYWTSARLNLSNLITIDRVTHYGVIFLTAMSFILSYDAIRQLAVMSGVNESLSWLYPLSVDAVALVAAVTVLRMTRTRDNKIYPWVITVLFAAVSIAFNILHYDGGAEWYVSISSWLPYVVHSIPPIAVILGFHLFILQKENDIKRTRGQTETDTVDTIGIIETEPVTRGQTEPVVVSSTDKPIDKVGQRRRQVQALLSQGKTQQDIAKNLGVHVKTISRDIAAISDNGKK